MPTLSSIHEALSRAALAKQKDEIVLVTLSCRVPEDVAEVAHKIARRNGANVNRFLAECITLLTKDYGNVRKKV